MNTSKSHLECDSEGAAVGFAAAIATASPHATAAALEMLRAGGNAADAAAAAAWALAVCEPSGSGLGGQTTILIHDPAGRTLFLDGHSYAPAAASTRSVSKESQRRGRCATTVPSTPATLAAATQGFGRLTTAEVLQPAIRLAQEGLPVSRLLRRHIRWCASDLAACPYASRFFLPNGRPPRRGRRLRQRKLARTLVRLATQGVEDFYEGKIARRIVRDMADHGGLVTHEDLADVRLPIERRPFEISYHDHRVLSGPPPGGGLQVLLGLKVLAALDAGGPVATETDDYERVALVIDAVFRERERWPLQPDRVPRSMRDWLLSDGRAAELAADIRVNPRRSLSGPEEPGETTHLCVADQDGMVVSLTQSIQSLFGAKVAHPKLGFFYNNYLCTCPRYPHPSRLRPHALPQSNAAPTLVMETIPGGEERPLMTLGAAGSRRITSSILQVLRHVLDHGLALPEAVGAPRVHPTLRGEVMLERRAAHEPLTTRLRERFDRVVVKADRSHAMGAVQALGRDASGRWVAVADPRREGAADAY